MNQLSLQPGLASRWAMAISSGERFISNRLFLVFALAVIALLPSMSFAQEVTFPTVDIDGVEDDSSGSEILVAIFKWAGRLIIWGVMGWAGITCLKTILASWQEQKSKEAGRWGALVADSFGSVVMVMVVVAVGLWILSFIK